jgi:hypothetical protein
LQTVYVPQSDGVITIAVAGGESRTWEVTDGAVELDDADVAMFSLYVAVDSSTMPAQAVEPENKPAEEA